MQEFESQEAFEKGLGINVDEITNKTFDMGFDNIKEGKGLASMVDELMEKLTPREIAVLSAMKVLTSVKSAMDKVLDKNPILEMLKMLREKD
jgi:hypothetical protein